MFGFLRAICVFASNACEFLTSLRAASLWLVGVSLRTILLLTRILAYGGDGEISISVVLIVLVIVVSILVVLSCATSSRLIFGKLVHVDYCDEPGGY